MPEVIIRTATRCWDGNPAERPEFSELCLLFESFYEEIPHSDPSVAKKDPGICGDLVLDETVMGSSTLSLANLGIGESTNMITLPSVSSSELY